MRNVLGFSFHDKLNEENAFNHQHSLIICILELKPLSLHKTKKHTCQKIQLTDKNKNCSLIVPHCVTSCLLESWSSL